MFWVTLLNQLYWVTGATLGGILGSFIPFNTNGIEFVMTAMMTVIFLDQWLKEKQHISSLIGMIGSVACLLIFGADNFLLPTMALVVCLLTAFRNPITKRAGYDDDN